MKILVTGATGFIGTALSRSLSEMGHIIIALSRQSLANRDMAVKKTYLWAEPTSMLPPIEAFDGVEAVIHLAGESVAGRWTAGKKRAIRESRILGTRNMVLRLASLTNKPYVLISASAVGYYGDREDEILTESSNPGADFLSGVCKDWESEAKEAAELGIRTVQLRTGIVLGRAGGALSAMLLPFKLGLGGPLGSGRQWWSWIHQEDVVGLIVHALTEKRISGALNATAPNPVTQREFAKTLGRVLGRPAYLPTPAFAVKLLAGEFSTELLSSKRVLPERALQFGYTFHFPELQVGLSEILQKPDERH